MPNSRFFAYNINDPIPGTIQIGNLAIGELNKTYQNSEGICWWNGPDEDLGYVIAYSQSDGRHPTSVNVLKWNSSMKGVNIRLSNNDKTAYVTEGQHSVLSTRGIKLGNKVIFSVKLTSAPYALGKVLLGIGSRAINFSSFIGSSSRSVGFSDIGAKFYNSNPEYGHTSYISEGSIIDLAIDTGNAIWLRVDGGDWNNDSNSDPSSNLGGYDLMDFFSNNSYIETFHLAATLFDGASFTTLNHPHFKKPSGYDFIRNEFASVGFKRTKGFTDQGFIDLVKSIPGEDFPNPLLAKEWLTRNGFWTSFELS